LVVTDDKTMPIWPEAECTVGLRVTGPHIDTDLLTHSMEYSPS